MRTTGRLLVTVLLTTALALGCAAPAPSPTTTVPATTKPTSVPTATTTLPPITIPPISTPPPPPLPHYTINITVNPPGTGSVTPSAGTYEAGSVIMVEAKPASPEWTFDYWGGDLGGKTATIPLTLNGNKNIIANFTKITFTLNVTVAPAGAGSVGPNSGVYDYGQTVTLVAKANPGFEFDHWAGDVSGTAASTNITMQSNKKIGAVFKSLYQVIKRDMAIGSAVQNTVSFTNYLKAGDKVQGFVELTGEDQPGDTLASWDFAITGPQGIFLENWQGNVRTSQHHDIDKTVVFEGTYTIKASDTSRFPKSLTIQISPGGWQ